MRTHIHRHPLIAAAVGAAMLSTLIATPVLADTITIVGADAGQQSTATVVCEFNPETNTFTFTITNTSAITFPGSTSTIVSIGFDLPPEGNANASGLNGFTGMQAPSLSSDFSFSDADVGAVGHGFNSAVLDFAFLTGPSGSFGSGSVADGLLPGESASFTTSGAAFVGFTEEQICNSIYVRYQNVPNDSGSDVGSTHPPVVYQPDARIKRAGGKVHGNNVYNTTGDGQAVKMRRPKHSLRRFWVSIQNDGVAADRFQVTVDGATPDGFEVLYYRNRSMHDLTAAIEAGTFVTKELLPGEKFRIRVQVTITKQALKGTKMTRLFSVTSDNDSNGQDAVRLKVKRV